jgi:hypothetical protein
MTPSIHPPSAEGGTGHQRSGRWHSLGEAVDRPFNDTEGPSVAKVVRVSSAVLRFDSCQGISCFSDALAPPRNSDSRSWDPKRNRTCLQTFLVAERFDGSRMYRCCIVVAELASLARNMAKSASPEYKRGHYWNTGFRQSTRSCRPSEEFPRF